MALRYAADAASASNWVRLPIWVMARLRCLVRRPRRAAIAASRSPVVGPTLRTRQSRLDGEPSAACRPRALVGRPTIKSMPDFDVYRLSDEHVMLRQAVRELADDKIAPRAAEIDETAEFPFDVLDALVRAGFHAVHIPEEYGGAGADAIATAIVIEEVARACASSSLIPAVNKLGTMPLLLAASEDLKKQVLPPVAAGEAMFSYALSEREAGSDAAAMRTRAVLDGDHWVLNGTKCWISNAGVSTYYTVMAVTDPSAGPRGISAFVVHRDDPGFSVGPKERKLGIKGSPTCEIYLE